MPAPFTLGHKLSYVLPYALRCWLFRAAFRVGPHSPRLFFLMWAASRPVMDAAEWCGKPATMDDFLKHGVPDRGRAA